MESKTRSLGTTRPRLFDWLLLNFSYQGISDQVARNYIRQHGNASWADIAEGLKGTLALPSAAQPLGF